MRILFLSTYFRPDVASTGVIMSTLAAEFVARGNEVTVLTSVPHYDGCPAGSGFSGKLIHREQVGPMSVYRVHTHVARKRANVAERILSYAGFSLLSFLRGATLPKHDVILVPSPPLSNGVIADLLGRLSGTPFVYTVQDIWPDVAIRAGVLRSPTAIHCLNKMESYVYRRAAEMTVISDGFRRNLLAKGVSDEKVTVIPNFIDIGFVTPRPKVNSFSIGQKLEKKFVVLFAGNMGFSQGLESVLDAAKLLGNSPDIEFLMVGNGASRTRAQEYTATLGLSNVRFLPYQPHEELPDMYGAADVCLIPLRRGFTAESVPCKLFTIMAAGRPAVAAVDPGSETWDLLERSRGGVCVEPEKPAALADAILRYYRDPAARQAAGEAGLACVRRDYQPGAIAELYLEVLRRVVSKRATAAGR